MDKVLQSKTHLFGVILSLVIAVSPALLTAQVLSPPKKPADQTSSPPDKPDQIPSPKKPDDQTEKPKDKTKTEKQTIWSPANKLAGKLTFQQIDRQVGSRSLAVTRGVRLLVENRSTGRIIVHGWDRDVIEAHAVSERGEEVIMSGQSEGDGPKLVFLKADYINLDGSGNPTQPLDLPPLGKDGPIQVHLEVNVPRYAELEVIKVTRSNVEITAVETPIMILGQASNLMLKDVGSVEAHTRTGSITIENARGIADLTSSTGGIKISDSRGAVRAVSITGPIEVSCVKGRVDVGNTSGPIELVGIDGDIEAIAASSNVRFMGPLSDDGRYYMKSMSGRVEMILPANTRGLNALLTSYQGTVESDFSLRPKSTAHEPDSASHRLSGRFGNGSPQITLDSFAGLVKLSKVPSSSIVSCH
jgi:hypothetical protein